MGEKRMMYYYLIEAMFCSKGVWKSWWPIFSSLALALEQMQIGRGLIKMSTFCEDLMWKPAFWQRKGKTNIEANYTEKLTMMLGSVIESGHFDELSATCGIAIRIYERRHIGYFPTSTHTDISQDCCNMRSRSRFLWHLLLMESIHSQTVNLP